MKRLAFLALALAGGVLFPGDARAQGVNEFKFCFVLTVETTDGGVGEDYGNPDDQGGGDPLLLPARGILMDLHRPVPEPQLQLVADEDGCVSFRSDARVGFKALLYSRAFIGQDRNIRVTAFPDTATAANGDLSGWLITADPGTAGGTFVYNTGPADVVSNLLGWGVHIIHQIDSNTTPRLADFRRLDIVNEASSDGGSETAIPRIRIQPDGNRKKFLIAHEVGHWLEYHWQDQSWGGGGSWGLNGVDPDCAWVGVGDHALRSVEHNSGAFLEGFAHYMSALAFNDHEEQTGYWRYYKDAVAGLPAYQDLVAGDYVVNVESGPVGGFDRWLETKCPADNTSGRGVELDWLRFWWDYRTNAGQQPTHWDIFHHLAFAAENYTWNNQNNIWPKLLEAMADFASQVSQFEQRFTDLGVANGVAH